MKVFQISNTCYEFAPRMLRNSSVVPVCPSTTRWTAHNRACMVVFKNFQASYEPYLLATMKEKRQKL